LAEKALEREIRLQLTKIEVLRRSSMLAAEDIFVRKLGIEA
jgi:hypothetical protein